MSVVEELDKVNKIKRLSQTNTEQKFFTHEYKELDETNETSFKTLARSTKIYKYIEG